MGVGVMAKFTCSCGARYKFPDTLRGKRAKCKKCGEVFTLEVEDEGVIPIADEPVTTAPSTFENPVAPELFTKNPQQGEVFIPSGHSGSRVASASDSPALDVAAPSGKSFSSDVLWAFLFPAIPGNLAVFLIILFVMVTGPYIPIVGFIINIFVIGWYAAFRFAVIKSSAAGEENLPNVNVSNDFWGDFIAPLFQWAGSWIIVMLPAYLYLFAAIQQGSIPSQVFYSVLVGGIGGSVQSASGMYVFYLLLFTGLFLWPMVALCLAMGGFSTLYRIDLILLTICKTFFSYVCIFLVIVLAVVLQQIFAGLISSRLTPTSPASVTQVIGLHFMINVVSLGTFVYLEIVIMRLIGLYYHHYKKKFAWSWE